LVSSILFSENFIELGGRFLAESIFAKKTTLINSLEQVFKRKYYSFGAVFGADRRHMAAA
jgi:hypothetical protein